MIDKYVRATLMAKRIKNGGAKPNNMNVVLFNKRDGTAVAAIEA